MTHLEESIFAAQGISEATAKTVKVTLVLDPAGITVEDVLIETDLNSKSYGVENCNVILEGSMRVKGNIEGAGLVIQPKKQKEEIQKDS